MINAIRNNRYRLPDRDKGEQMGLGKNYFPHQLYILEVQSSKGQRSYNLGFAEINGSFNLAYMPYYE